MAVTLVCASILAAGLAFETLFGVAAFLGVCINAIVYLCLFRLRSTEPELSRPFRAVGYPWLPAIAVLISLGLLINFVIADPFSSAVALVTLAATWPIHRFSQRAIRTLAAPVSS
jgi:APA family basic amino acid/polyamine antiporter